MSKRIVSVLLIIIFMFSFIFSAYAEGDPNIDGGGGGMGDGTSENKWTPGMDGVRVSVIDVKTGSVVGTPIDYSSKDPSLDYHFGKKSKIHYKMGDALTPVSTDYIRIKPIGNMPTIVPSGAAGSNLEAIKEYFCSEAVAGMIAKDFNVSFEHLTGGKFKLFLEPIAYFTFQGKMVGMTAHEAALYDQQLSGELRQKMTSLTHQNLPLSMYLEHEDLGFPVYGGSNSGIKDNNTIINELGMGTVSYKEPPNDPKPGKINLEYRVNTEVITAVTLKTDAEINPSAPATVTFNILGSTYTVNNIVIPEYESQLVWCKWKTPATEQSVTITVTTTEGNLSEDTINASIINLDKNPPPDPKADDRNDYFIASAVPINEQKTFAKWTVWNAAWQPNWVWVPNWVWFYNGISGYWFDLGKWEDKGKYNFSADIYTASLTAESKIKPDEKVPTANGKNMKSGYGVNNTVTSSFISNAPDGHVTKVQTAVSYFPEFQYDNYWRLLETTSGKHEFRKNQYSTYNQRVHFTPVWFKDGPYDVYTWVLDAWTPDGMLSMNLQDGVTIKGSVYDDWHIGPLN